MNDKYNETQLTEEMKYELASNSEMNEKNEDKNEEEKKDMMMIPGLFDSKEEVKYQQKEQVIKMMPDKLVNFKQHSSSKNKTMNFNQNFDNENKGDLIKESKEEEQFNELKNKVVKQTFFIPGFGKKN
jgi:hypothetical protein